MNTKVPWYRNTSDVIQAVIAFATIVGVGVALFAQSSNTNSNSSGIAMQINGDNTGTVTNITAGGDVNIGSAPQQRTLNDYTKKCLLEKISRYGIIKVILQPEISPTRIMGTTTDGKNFVDGIFYTTTSADSTTREIRNYTDEIGSALDAAGYEVWEVHSLGSGKVVQGVIISEAYAVPPSIGGSEERVVSVAVGVDNRTDLCMN